MPRIASTVALLYSGGVNNTNPALSIGGAASTAAGRYIASQSYTASAIQGIEITHAARNSLGTGYLSFTVSNSSVTWISPGGSSSSAAIAGTWVAVGSTVTGFLRLKITPAALPTSDIGQNITIANVPNTLFAGPSANQIISGLTEYRALYLYNQSSLMLFDVNLVLTDSAPVSTLSVGSTFAALSSYASTQAEILNLGFQNMMNGTPPFSTSVSSQPREALGTTTPIGSPSMSFFDSTSGQDSDGLTKDVEPAILNAEDTTGLLSRVQWASSLYWARIKPGKMVSFWTKRTIPPNPTRPTSEQALFDITFSQG